MPARPSWHDEYWKQLDKDTAKKIRTTCPRCGRCEASFTVKGFSDKKPWWKRLFRK